MSAFAGPEVANNGLVFYYDINNTEKSWKGKPTTNLYDFSFYQAEGGHTGSRTVGDAPDLNTSVVDYHTITTAGSWVSEANRLIIWPLTELSASTTYRVSFWARVTSKGSTTIRSAFYGNNTNNTHNLTPSWQRFSYSSTTHSAYRALEFGSSDGAITFQVAGIQWESNDFETPYTKTSRSNTQSILDLTNNNTLTLNDLTYNSNGTFEFNGTTNYARCTNSCGLTDSITLSAWIKNYYSGSGPHKTVICTDIGYQYGVKLMTYKNYSRYGLWLGFNTSNYEALINVDINDNITKMLTGSWNRTTGEVRLYVNGILTSSINTGQTSVIALADGLITVGAEYHSIGNNGFGGNIYSAQIYNRVLSDAEVSQNFQASRGRYGI